MHEATTVSNPILLDNCALSLLPLEDVASLSKAYFAAKWPDKWAGGNTQLVRGHGGGRSSCTRNTFGNIARVTLVCKAPASASPSFTPESRVLDQGKPIAPSSPCPCAANLMKSIEKCSGEFFLSALSVCSQVASSIVDKPGSDRTPGRSRCICTDKR